MRVAYGDSNVLRCSVQFAYDRFFTAYTKKGEHRQFAVQTPVGTVESKERDAIVYNNTVPSGSFGISEQGRRDAINNRVYKQTGIPANLPAGSF